MESSQTASRSALRPVLIFLFVIVLPLIVGVFFAHRVVPKPAVGIIRLNNEIAAVSTFEIVEQLAYARTNSQIKAVVLVINSPGGSAALSEELYLNILQLREEMPVVATVDLLAASGGYYIAAAADEIYAKPTSGVGSIGVVAFLPGEVFIEEEILTTGPYKSFGGTRDSSVRQIERAKNAFLEAVVNGRGERLAIDLVELSRAEIYTGIQALEFGLIDGLRATEAVVARAAELAGMRSYETVELYPLTFADGDTDAALSQYTPPEVNVARLFTPNQVYAPGLYYLYFELPEHR